MSSHHIIRENQEPALWLSTVETNSESQVLEFLEWSPVLIVDSRCLEFNFKHGIQADIVIGTPKTKYVEEGLLNSSKICRINELHGVLKEKNIQSIYQFGKYSETQLIHPDYKSYIVSLFSNGFQRYSGWHNSEFSKWMVKGTRLIGINEDNLENEAAIEFSEKHNCWTVIRTGICKIQKIQPHQWPGIEMT